MATEMVLIPKTTYERLREGMAVAKTDVVEKDESEQVPDKPHDETATISSDAPPDKNVNQLPQAKASKLYVTLVEQFPENYRLYAKRLLGYIKKHGSSVLGWNDNDNTLIYRDSLVTGSNIVDLINHLFKTNSNPPRGNERFKKGLTELKVPKAYLKPYLLNPPSTSDKIKKTWLKY